MPGTIEIRETTSSEIAEVLALYPLAFPDEELRPVVTQLLELGDGVLSLAAFDQDDLIGHIIFTDCGTKDGSNDGALLAPLGVLPSHQSAGIGSMLVREGFKRSEARGINQVFVLGDPAYYSRFGFEAERAVSPPYPMPEEWADAWQSVTLAGRQPLESGQLKLPEPWMDPALWGP